MRDLSSVAKQVRIVRNARRRFLELWKLEKDVINPVLDRMADELRDPVPSSSQPDEGRAGSD